jgi:8-oxo-dGTP pyrophosphatase MutT (NUDIX family)
MAKPDKIIDRVLYGVDAVIFHPDGRVLMFNRDPSRESFKTGWEFIKGALKVDEGYLEAATREIAEEAGIRVQHIGTLPGTFDVDARYRKKPNYDFVRKKALVFVYLQGEIIVDRAEHTEWRWMPFKEAHALVWVDNGQEILERAREVFTIWKSQEAGARKC